MCFFSKVQWKRTIWSFLLSSIFTGLGSSYVSGCVVVSILRLCPAAACLAVSRCQSVCLPQSTRLALIQLFLSLDSLIMMTVYIPLTYKHSCIQTTIELYCHICMLSMFSTVIDICSYLIALTHTIAYLSSRCTRWSAVVIESAMTSGWAHSTYRALFLWARQLAVDCRQVRPAQCVGEFQAILRYFWGQALKSHLLLSSPLNTRRPFGQTH